ncbi:hypothetical protein I7I48_11484 [Histoplasma ohiense]|nr:hypothetical protein I7I48_11484 [Histoplasma ohiense (nom. inval.)]
MHSCWSSLILSAEPCTWSLGAFKGRSMCSIFLFTWLSVSKRTVPATFFVSRISQWIFWVVR